MAAGVYILQNTMARGGGNGAGEKTEKWGSEEKERKREKEKRESIFFVRHTLVDNCIST